MKTPPVQSIDLPAIRRLYRSGVNIIDHLRGQLGAQFNTEQLVETSYDMQSGSYVRFVEAHPERVKPYHDELAGVLDRFVEEGDVILDVGTGEMTTLAALAKVCYQKASAAYAADISLSRLVVGQRYLHRHLPSDLTRKIRPVVSTLFRLPFADDGLDVVWTSHALEPNGGREEEALREIVRIARRDIVLFEPSYENNSPEGRERMERLGYVKGMPEVVAGLPGVTLVDVIRIAGTENPLNPTHAYVLRKQSVSDPRMAELRCPLSHGPLEQRNGYLYSTNALLAYPVIEDIPILRVEKGISASVLDTGEVL